MEDDVGVRQDDLGALLGGNVGEQQVQPGLLQLDDCEDHSRPRGRAARLPPKLTIGSQN